MQNSQLTKHHYRLLASVAAIAFTGVLIQGIFGGRIFELFHPINDTSLSTINAGATFVGPALSLLRTGTFNNGGPGYIGIMQRGPVYPVVIALSFLTFGERVASVIFVNIVSLLVAIVFLFLISKRFFPEGWEFLPPLALALFSGTSAMVWLGNYELFILALVSCSLFSFFRYHDTGNLWWLLAGGLCFSFWILEKPIVLYVTPALMIILFAWHFSIFSKRKILGHFLIFVFLVGAVVGMWSFRNYRVLDTWQLGSGGHVLLRRSSQVDLSFAQIINAGLSFVVGDYIGAKLSKTYPIHGNPPAWNHGIEDRWYQRSWLVTDIDGLVITRTELDKRMYKEAVSNIQRAPVKFLLTSFLGFSRLNGPLNYNGQELMGLFFESHNNLPPSIKIVFILGIRGAWYTFLGLALYAMFAHRKDWRTWGLLSLLIVYYNSMHALFTHAEARYILTMMPFYFLFFVEGLRGIILKTTED